VRDLSDDASAALRRLWTSMEKWVVVAERDEMSGELVIVMHFCRGEIKHSKITPPSEVVTGKGA